MVEPTHVWRGYWRWSYGTRPYRRATVVYCVSCGAFEDASSRGVYASDKWLPCKRGPMNEWTRPSGT